VRGRARRFAHRLTELGAGPREIPDAVRDDEIG